MAIWGRGRRSAPRAQVSRHGRHGRAGRSQLVRPPLPQIDTRIEKFDMIVGSTIEYLRGSWPELREVEVDIAWLPPVSAVRDEVPRWSLDREGKRIILYRVPIERFGRLHRNDDLHRRLLIEGAVFRAAGDYLDRDPWDLGPDRFRF